MAAVPPAAAAATAAYWAAFTRHFSQGRIMRMEESWLLLTAWKTGWLSSWLWQASEK
jgi:hypothetical protein